MLYQKAKYSAAIDAYTEAITLCPRWILPIINRALCHRKKKNWLAVGLKITRLTLQSVGS